MWDRVEEHREKSNDDLQNLQKQLDEQNRMVQRLGKHMDGHYDKLYQDVEHEHGWVFKHFQGVKVLVENNHTSLVGKVEEFTGALNKAWEMQQASVQQALGMILGTDEAVGRITQLEKQLQEAEQRWEKTTFGTAKDGVNGKVDAECCRKIQTTRSSHSADSREYETMGNLARRLAIANGKSGENGGNTEK